MGSKTFTNEQLIQLAKQQATELNKDTLGKREFKHYQQAKKLFGSWNNFLLECGLRVRNLKNQSKEYWINLIQEQYNKTGETPTIRDIEKNTDLPSSAFAANTWGWNNLIKEAIGIENIIKANVSKEIDNLSDGELLSMLKEEIIRLQNLDISCRVQSNFNYYRSKSLPSCAFYEERFNLKWSKILALINIDNRQYIRSTSNDKLIEKLEEELIKQAGYNINYRSGKEFSKNRTKGLPCSRTYEKRFNMKWEDIVFMLMRG